MNALRYLILSDVHANLEALEAVLAAAPRADFDRVLVLGDLVGYGASPNEVMAQVASLRPDVLIRGNHDKVASGLEDTEDFNYLAAEAARWTQTALTPPHRRELAALPAGPRVVDGLVEVCHGTPYDEDAYIFDELDALRAIEATQQPICFFGHTHVQVAFSLRGGRLDIVWPGRNGTTPVALERSARYLINPGSVGQPRDGDPRAAFATFDSETREVVLRRVAYRVDLAQQRITAAGLPAALAERLGVGR